MGLVDRTPFQAVRRRAVLARVRVAAVSMLAVAVVALAGWILPGAFPATALTGPSSLTVSSELAARVAATVPDEPTGFSLIAAPVAPSTASGTAAGPAAGAPAGVTASLAEVPASGVDVGTGPPPADAPTQASLSPSAAPSPSSVTEIDVSAHGHQAEVDRCLWVRMDLGAVAPIVGAHNFCGGDVVLDLEPGDLVRLTGERLDGLYEVTGSRDAYAGDNAAMATAGLLATVLLQTCYYDSDAMRLVTLVPAAP